MENINQENQYLDLTIMNKMSLLILAGGMGSRYKGQKQIDGLSENGETLMEFAIYDALKMGIGKFVFIINNQFPEEYKNKLIRIIENRGAEPHFIEQEIESYIPENYLDLIKDRTKPLGTAHAVLCAKEVVQEPFITMNADDFYGQATFQKAVQHIQNGQIRVDNYAMLGFELERTLSDNGSVSRGICTLKGNQLYSVEEFTHIQKEGGHIHGMNEELKPKKLDAKSITSMNFWILDPSFFDKVERDLNEFLKNIEQPLSAEFYLPSVVDKAIQNKEIKVDVIPTLEKWFGLTYPGDRALVVNELIQQKEVEIYPNSLWENLKQ